MSATVEVGEVNIEALASYLFGFCESSDGRRWNDVDEDTRSRWRDNAVVGLRCAEVRR